MKEKVQAALDKIRPALQRDGGDVELVEVTAEGMVKVRLRGACGGCPMSQMTLKMGIEKVIKEAVPQSSRWRPSDRRSRDLILPAGAAKGPAPPPTPGPSPGEWRGWGACQRQAQRPRREARRGIRGWPADSVTA